MMLLFSFLISITIQAAMSSLTRYSVLPLQSIDLSNTAFSLFADSNQEHELSLTKSIRQFGMLQPPLLLQDKNYIVLSGRKRVKIAATLGRQELPCLVIQKDANLLDLYQTLLTHAQTGSTLSIIEQAVLLSKAEEVLPEQQVLTLLPFMGYKKQPYKLREMKALLQLDPAVIGALHTGQLQGKAGTKLTKFSRQDQQTLVRLIEHFKLGGSKQQKLLSYATELVMRTDRPFEDIVHSCTLEETSSDNRPQKATAFLKHLQEQCFPNIHKAEEQFHQLRQSVQLAQNTSLHHTQSFEDDKLTLSIVFENEDIFRKKWKKLKNDL